MAKKLGLVAAVLAGAVAIFLFATRGSDGDGAAPEPEADPGPGARLSSPAASLREEAASATGTVVSADDGSPIEGASVRALRLERGASSQAELFSAVTSEDGSFDLERLPPGRYSVSASSPDHLASSEVVELAPGEDVEAIELRLGAGGHLLSGRVRDVTGGPVAGALVSATLMRGALEAVAEDSATAITGADGRFSLRLGSGRYRVLAEHESYVPRAARVEIAGADRLLDLELAPGGVIEGIALESGSGKPAPGAVVSYRVERLQSLPDGTRIASGGAGGHTVTDAEGRFRLRGLGSGAVSLSARAPGLATREAVQVALGVAEQVGEVTLHLDAAGSIEGTVVTRSDREPAAGVSVVADSAEGAIAAVRPTGEDGAFVIDGVTPGRYRLIARSDLYLSDPLGVPVKVEDEAPAEVTLEVDRGAIVRGQVTPGGIADVQAFVRRETRAGPVQIPLPRAGDRTGEDGRFALGPVRPGPLSLVARDTEGRRGRVELEVPRAGLEDVEIALEQGARVSGEVVDASGDPVDDAVVSVRRVERGARFQMIVNGTELTAEQAPTAGDGRFTVGGLAAGDYELEVLGPDRLPLRWADKEGLEPRRLTLEEGQERSGLTLRVEERDADLEGVVLAPDGQPAADVWVSLTPSAPELGPGALRSGPGPRGPAPAPSEPRGGAEGEGEPAPRERVESRMVVAQREEGGVAGLDLGASSALPPFLTDRDGRFSFSGLREGQYDLVAEGLGGRARGFARGAETGEEVSISMQELTRLEGRVTLDGDPVERFSVELSGPGLRRASVEDESGLFAIHRLDPGDYEVRVRSLKGEGKTTARVRAGESTEVEVALTPAVRVKGTLISSGEPRAGAIAVAVPDRGDGQLMVRIDSGDAPARTNADGRFELGVSPGRYQLLFLDPRTPGGPLARVPLEVTGEQAELDLGRIDARSGQEPEPG